MPIMDVQTLSFKNSREWRNWLENNSEGHKGVWLVIHKKNSSRNGISYDEALEEAICFGWIDGKMQSVDDEKYILRYSPRKDRSVWSKKNKDTAILLIEQGRMTEAGMAVIEKAKKNGNWDAAYTNKTRDDIPVDLQKALMKEPKALNNFEKFANSYRNTYIGWITGAKTAGTRKKRITEVVKRSTLNIKPGID